MPDSKANHGNVPSMCHSKVLITGGTGSLGRALVAEFAASGYSVTFQYHRDEVRAAELVRCHGAAAMRLDMAEPFELPEPMFDVVVNNAGVNISDALTHLTTLEDFCTTIQVNLVAAFLVVKQCLPWMLSIKSGRIINVSSIYGLRAVEGNLSYTVSKHGMSGLTRTVAKEYATHGITCNEICPGPVESDLMQKVASRVAAAEGGTPANYLEQLRQTIPARRLATPKEIATLAVFLASASAQYINGASIPIDGAWIV